jgi:hypothetical protein
MDKDVLEAMERDSLTIWGEAISAQIRDFSDLPGTHLALHIKENAPRSSENGNPVIVGPGDVAKLRELLNEAAAREGEGGRG